MTEKPRMKTKMYKKLLIIDKKNPLANWYG